jgi:hypothetical protein
MDLKGGSYTVDSAITLNAGYYIVTVNLENAEGKRASKREVMHIYKDRITKVADSEVIEFADGDFTLSALFGLVEELAAWLQSQLEILRRHPTK